MYSNSTHCADATRTCEGCETVIYVSHEEVSQRPWKSVWFCDYCRRTLPEKKIERLTREIALLGVPLS